MRPHNCLVGNEQLMVPKRERKEIDLIAIMIGIAGSLTSGSIFNLMADHRLRGSLGESGAPRRKLPPPVARSGSE
jgi:hypothetical protein